VKPSHPHALALAAALLLALPSVAGAPLARGEVEVIRGSHVNREPRSPSAAILRAERLVEVIRSTRRSSESVSLARTMSKGTVEVIRGTHRVSEPLLGPTSGL
jgi:hypothetical protein